MKELRIKIDVTFEVTDEHSRRIADNEANAMAELNYQLRDHMRPPLKQASENITIDEFIPA